MKPVHRLIICGNPYRWFKWVCKAHRNPKSGIYEINMGADCFKKYSFPDGREEAIKAAIKDALFILEEREQIDRKGECHIGEYYLTIIDRGSLADINKYRWHLPIGRNYWSTGYLLYLNKLHKYVVYLSGRTVNLGDNIHHINYYTFDNRNKNLDILSIRAHQLAHLDQESKKIKIEKFKPITNDELFEDFIKSVF